MDYSIGSNGRMAMWTITPMAAVPVDHTRAGWLGAARDRGRKLQGLIVYFSTREHFGCVQIYLQETLLINMGGNIELASSS
jgi:hypothetical protein